mgnify:CR=1 FL=1
MITSDDAQAVAGDIDSDATPVESLPSIRDGRMPLEVVLNYFTGAPRPARVPVAGQEILR